MSTVESSPTAAAGPTAWYTQEPDAVVSSLGADRERGLTEAEAARRLAEHGPNSIAA
jgi:Ca2+-transporting ATPase